MPDTRHAWSSTCPPFGGFNGAYAIAVDFPQNVYVAGDDIGLAVTPVIQNAGVNGSNNNGGAATVVKIAPQGQPMTLTAASLTSFASHALGLPYAGGLASLNLSGLTGVNGIVVARQFPLPTQLAGVTVKVGGEPAPILSIEERSPAQQQINFQVPFDQGIGSSNPFNAGDNLVEIDYNGAATFTGALPVAPGIFTLADGTPAIQHAADFSLVTPANPVQPAETLVIYATGLGDYGQLQPGSFVSSTQNGVPATGPAQLFLTSPVTAPLSIGVSIGSSSCDVLYAGPTPMYVGLYQINCITSAHLSAGSQKLQIILPLSLLGNNPTPDSVTHSNIVIVPVQ